MGAEQIRILLVEDNPGDARLLREMLAEPSRETFQLVHVERISEALARLSSDVFDAILLDLSLPEGQGLETVDLICRRVRHIPVVVAGMIKSSPQKILAQGTDCVSSTS
jgi:CheY-like chemotaxis protein